MFSTRSLFFLFGRSAPKFIIDPWKCYPSWYVTQCRAQFGCIAKALTDATHNVTVTLNPELKCAEFKDQTGLIVARVKVHGEMGRADEAFVQTVLDPERLEVFKEHLLPLRVHFEGW